jgi:hypothetical protein
MLKHQIVVYANFLYELNKSNLREISIVLFFIQLLVDDLLVWTGILDTMIEDNHQDEPVPFNTILFSNERILTEHEKHSVLEYEEIVVDF